MRRPAPAHRTGPVRLLLAKRPTLWHAPNVLWFVTHVSIYSRRGPMCISPNFEMSSNNINTNLTSQMELEP